jgi:hypothetical protein
MLSPLNGIDWLADGRKLLVHPSSMGEDATSSGSCFGIE